MSFRLRLTVLVSLAVAVAIVGTSFVVYYTDRHELLSQVDSDLVETQQFVPVNTVIRLGPAPGPAQIQRLLKGALAKGAVIDAPKGYGPVQHRGFKVLLPNSATAVGVHVARQLGATPVKLSPRFATISVRGQATRTLTLANAKETITLSRPLADVDRNLRHLRWLLVFVCIGGVGVAAILGLLVSSRAVAPLRRLTETTERIVETGDLSERIGHRGRDEISRLSVRLDELLGTLEASLRTQRQLVADASHELRTPIATLRANMELLGSNDRLDPHERTELLSDVQDELESMTTLVGELVELARGEEPDVAPREFRLDELVQSVVDRATRRAPAVSFDTRLEPTVVVGVPERVERAVANLVDNASKWSPPGAAVDVSVVDGVVEVRDRGPGIAAEDRPLVFNRFYRAAAARGMPGAGLGLAIVKQIADAHGGSVTADEASGGGAVLRLRLSPSR
jgi:two-component system, OmpR family, sensor histidine kinase MprB